MKSFLREFAAVFLTLSIAAMVLLSPPIIAWQTGSFWWLFLYIPLVSAMEAATHYDGRDGS